MFFHGPSAYEAMNSAPSTRVRRTFCWGCTHGAGMPERGGANPFVLDADFTKSSQMGASLHAHSRRPCEMENLYAFGGDVRRFR